MHWFHAQIAALRDFNSPYVGLDVGSMSGLPKSGHDRAMSTRPA
jgi:hypothetical protein